MVNLNPTKGSEQAGKRPVLIVSGNLLNKYSLVVWVCPLSTKIKNYKGDIVLEPTPDNGLSKTSEVLTLHLRSISRDRLEKKLGTIPVENLETVRKSVDEILKMD